MSEKQSAVEKAAKPANSRPVSPPMASSTPTNTPAKRTRQTVGKSTEKPPISRPVPPLNAENTAGNRAAGRGGANPPISHPVSPPMAGEAPANTPTQRARRAAGKSTEKPPISRPVPRRIGADDPSALAAQGVFGFVARLIEFGREFRAFCSREADEIGVSLHEIDVLMALDDLSGAPTVTAISTRSHVSKGTISRAVESLRGKGLVTVSPDPTDRRRLRVGLTDAARPILGRLYDAVRDCLALSFSDLPAAQWSRLRTLFRGLRDLSLPIEPKE